MQLRWKKSNTTTTLAVECSFEKNLTCTINFAWCEALKKGVTFPLSSQCTDIMVLSCYFKIKKATQGRFGLEV